ncbi:MAG: class I tRNA ligase family protein [Patescibacteria group bacterium]|jgi:valyl-tRNA synthetase
MEKAYDPKKVENRIYERWERSGFFNPDNLKKTKGEYCDVLPPPNANGELHLGHASGYVVMDLFGRYQRMLGKKVLLLPGKDHAGIQTQVVYEKKLKKERGLTRYDLGREKFYQECYAFCQDRSKYMRQQEKKIGLSADWSRERFTLDPELIKTVLETFVEMYNDGLIYRGSRIINWCPRCFTALSDIEVEYQEQTGKLYTFKYDKNFPFAISTTRPETKLGDTAVAVNPKDSRYKKYVGKTIEANFLGVPLKLKIIADREVDSSFGTGALGVTPAHSMVDYEMAQKNGLEMVSVINQEAKISLPGKFQDLAIAEARQKIVEELKANGLLEKEEDYKNNLSVCERCKTPIEQLISEQWFVNVDHPKFSLKQAAKKAIALGEIKIYPERFKKVMLAWTDNVHDWCISRQIWWGPRIPVWYKQVDKSTGRQVDRQKSKIEITYFVHGASTDNVAKRSSGHKDVSLSERGTEQAKERAKQIKASDFDVIFSSDLKRAVQTAEIYFGRGKFKQDKRLREISYGELNGHPVKEVGPLKEQKVNEPFPGGESYKQVEARIKDFLAEVAEKYPGKKIAIVAHQAPQLVLEVLTQNKTWEQAFKDDWRNIPNNWQPGWHYQFAGITTMKASVQSPGAGWVQDEDTLDTWFSSGQWVYTTLGYPKGKDFKTFYPSDTMITGRDLIYFWAFRMIIMSLYKTRKAPFKNLYFTGLIRDEKGQKMSKSKGNGIEPLEMIEKYGTDAVRLSLMIGSAPGNDMNLGEQKIAGFRNFTNKLWNISRYILESQTVRKPESQKAKTLADKWILSRLNGTVKAVTGAIEKYDFALAGETLRAFTWNELADWYLEISKVEGDKTKVLNNILETLLKLWHPFMPFVTEEIWSLMGKKSLLMVEPWPKAVGKADAKAEKEFALIQELIVAVRNLRQQNGVQAGQKIKAIIKAGKSEKLVKAQAEAIKFLAHLGELELIKSGKVDKAVRSVVGGVEIYLPLAGLVDLEQEKNKVNKEIELIEQYRVSLEKKLGNQEFTAKAPAAVVAVERQKLADAKVKLGKLKDQLKAL